jgi:hypothetical protein
MNKQEFYDNEQLITKQRFFQQNILENKITNNMLKINLSIYGISLAISVLSVLFFNEFFYLLPTNTNIDSNDRLLFSIFDFTHVIHGKHFTNSLNCVNDIECDNVCVNIDIIKIKLDYSMSCENYAFLRLAGLIVIKINKVCYRGNSRWMY